MGVQNPGSLGSPSLFKCLRYQSGDLAPLTSPGGSRPNIPTPWPPPRSPSPSQLSPHGWPLSESSDAQVTDGAGRAGGAQPDLRHGALLVLLTLPGQPTLSSSLSPRTQGAPSLSEHPESPANRRLSADARAQACPATCSVAQGRTHLNTALWRGLLNAL